jgi:hypothetical protein
MELVPIMRLAWRRRSALGLGVVIAVAAGLLLARGHATPGQAVASTRLVLDTPVSQLVGAAPKGVDTLGWRTELLSDLTTTAPMRWQIARAAGVPMRQLAVINPLLDTPVLPTTLPRRAAKMAPGTERYALTVLADGTLPMLALQGRAPSRAAARRLVAAAVTALKAAATRPAGAAGAQPVVAQSAGSILVESGSAGGRKKRAAVGFAAALVLWWGAVLIAPAVLARLRGDARPARFA